MNASPYVDVLATLAWFFNCPYTALCVPQTSVCVFSFFFGYSGLSGNYGLGYHCAGLGHDPLYEIVVCHFVDGLSIMALNFVVRLQVTYACSCRRGKCKSCILSDESLELVSSSSIGRAGGTSRTTDRIVREYTEASRLRRVMTVGPVFSVRVDVLRSGCRSFR